MNIVILIQSSNDPKYAPCVEVLRRTWASINVPGIEVLFYFGVRDDMPHPPPDGQLLLGDTLICDTPDVHYMSAGKFVEVRTPKYVMAVDYVLREMDVDYIYRCNCTCYVDQEKLHRYMLNRPKSGCYAGTHGCYENRIHFVSGCDMVVSRDIARKIVRDRAALDPDLIDDVAFGKLVTDRYIKPEEIHEPHPLLFYTEVVEEHQRIVQDHPGVFHYKFSATTMDALVRFHERLEADRARRAAHLNTVIKTVSVSMRERVQCVGAPFRVEWSSNSNRKPELFEWTGDPSQATVDTTVYIDTGIPKGLDHPGRKIAWFIESQVMSDENRLTQFLRTNLAAVSEAYDVILVTDRSLCDLHPKIVYHPAGSNLPSIAREQYDLHPKNKLCSMFSSTKECTNGHMLRQHWEKKLRGKVDLYGGFGGSPRIDDDSINPDKRGGLFPYMFNIAIENCKVDTYYTVKLTDCFATGTVPVYWGSARVGEIFDSNGIIFLNGDFDLADLSKDRYLEMLPAIRNNLEIVSRLEGSDDLLFRRYISRRPEHAARRMQFSEKLISITLNASTIPHGPHLLWIFALFDETEQEVFRHDIYDKDVLERRTDQIIVCIKDEQLRRNIVKALIWPMLADGTFLDRHEYVIEYDPVSGRIAPRTPSFDLRTEGYERRDDYKCWVFALLNGHGEEIFRGDIYDPAILGLETRRYTITDQKILLAGPVQYVLWPLLRDGTFLERRQESIKWVK